MFKGFFQPVDLVDSLIIPWFLLGEHRAREMCEVKGRLAMASKFKLWLHLESINSEMLEYYMMWGCCRQPSGEEVEKNEQLFLFGIFWIPTFIPTFLKQKVFHVYLILT